MIFGLSQICSVGTLWNYIFITFKIVSSLQKNFCTLWLPEMDQAHFKLYFCCAHLFLLRPLGPYFILKRNVLGKYFWILKMLIATGIALIECFSLLDWSWIWIYTSLYLYEISSQNYLKEVNSFHANLRRFFCAFLSLIFI